MCALLVNKVVMVPGVLNDFVVWLRHNDLHCGRWVLVCWFCVVLRALVCYLLVWL